MRLASLATVRGVAGDVDLPRRVKTLDYANVLCFFALFTGHRVELDELTFVEALVTVALDVGEMDENVITLLTRDEAETLFCIEKLHCSLCHEYSILHTKVRPIRTTRQLDLTRPGCVSGQILCEVPEYPYSQRFGSETTA